MTDDSQKARRERMSANSKSLLDAIDELHPLEQRKRSEVISTPASQELAEEIQRKSRRVFTMATGQVAQAEEVATSDVTMNAIGGPHADAADGR